MIRPAKGLSLDPAAAALRRSAADPGHGQDRVQGRPVSTTPGPALGLGLCTEHLDEYVRDSLLDGAGPAVGAAVTGD